jgi:hypothetical protein
MAADLTLLVRTTAKCDPALDAVQEGCRFDIVAGEFPRTMLSPTAQAASNAYAQTVADFRCLCPDPTEIKVGVVRKESVGLPSPYNIGGHTHEVIGHKDVVVDTAIPYVQKVSAASPDGTYTTGMHIDLLVHFSHAVVVQGTPALQLQTGGFKRRLPVSPNEHVNRVQALGASSSDTAGTSTDASGLTNADAVYIDGSGTSTLRFRYTVRFRDEAALLDYTHSGALRRNVYWDDEVREQSNYAEGAERDAPFAVR